MPDHDCQWIYKQDIEKDFYQGKHMCREITWEECEVSQCNNTRNVSRGTWYECP
jgi:hypothetical protein